MRVTYRIQPGGILRSYTVEEKQLVNPRSLALGVTQTAESVRRKNGDPFVGELGLSLTAIPYITGLLVERTDYNTVHLYVEDPTDWLVAGEKDETIHMQVMRTLNPHHWVG